MSEEPVESRIRAIVARHFDRPNVEDPDLFAKDLGADSLDITELIMSLEEEFDLDIEIDNKENPIETVGDLILYIKKRI
ncbi:MAG: phosphopantetheine-binding protein [Candidatus Buchananbacteria bacterium]|nr:phosphopantetheine-binding protein [Candidatus Buchananbacteria bacterium]